MIKSFKIFLFLLTLFLSGNVNAKPVPPGAGDGDVAANILFLVDSSTSMGRWIGGDGLGASWGVTYDSQDRILIGQNARRTLGAVVRYTAAGARDRSFRPIRTVPGAGCSVHLDATRNNLSGRMRKAANVRFVENLEINGGNGLDKVLLAFDSSIKDIDFTIFRENLSSFEHFDFTNDNPQNVNLDQSDFVSLVDGILRFSGDENDKIIVPTGAEQSRTDNDWIYYVLNDVEIAISYDLVIA